MHLHTHIIRTKYIKIMNNLNVKMHSFFLFNETDSHFTPKQNTVSD